ncbi:hypothetical protein V8C35DRAFT_285884, partial [Trichoderma chlorosporum]
MALVMNQCEILRMYADRGSVGFIGYSAIGCPAFASVFLLLLSFLFVLIECHGCLHHHVFGFFFSVFCQAFSRS